MPVFYGGKNNKMRTRRSSSGPPGIAIVSVVLAAYEVYALIHTQSCTDKPHSCHKTLTELSTTPQGWFVWAWWLWLGWHFLMDV